MFHLRRCRQLAPRRARRYTEQRPVHENLEQDFRPPWVYTTVRLLSYTLIPATAIWAIFFYDFGDHQHVFQHTRAWALKQKAQFFGLTPEEAQLLDRQKNGSSLNDDESL